MPEISPEPEVLAPLLVGTCFPQSSLSNTSWMITPTLSSAFEFSLVDVHVLLCYHLPDILLAAGPPSVLMCVQISELILIQT